MIRTDIFFNKLCYILLARKTLDPAAKSGAGIHNLVGREIARIQLNPL